MILVVQLVVHRLVGALVAPVLKLVISIEVNLSGNVYVVGVPVGKLHPLKKPDSTTNASAPPAWNVGNSPKKVAFRNGV